jgi:hypothetical protein
MHQFQQAGIEPQDLTLAAWMFAVCALRPDCLSTAVSVETGRSELMKLSAHSGALLTHHEYGSLSTHFVFRRELDRDV